MKSTEQQTYLKFLVRLGKTPTEGSRSTPASLWKWSNVKMSSFRVAQKVQGRKMTPGGGRPSTSKTEENVERVRQKVRSGRRLTVRMIANELSMNSERVWIIITEELGMRKICVKMVPRLLTDEQEWRVEVCQDILTRLKTDRNLLGRTITGDESWIFGYVHSPSNRALSGRVQCHQGQRKRGCPSPKSNWSWSLSLMWGELFTKSSYLKASTITKIFCGVWCSQRVRKGNCGMRNHRCFITTMPHQGHQGP